LAPLSICLFGPFEALVNGIPLPRLRSRKGQWLLALLALRAGREVERSWLIGMLWPESRREAAALDSLRSSLKDLRRALGAEAGRLRSPTHHSLALDLSGAEADVLAFDTAIASGDRPSLERAVALYRGPFLEACQEPWAFEARQVREQAYLAALEALAAQALVEGNPTLAEHHLRRAVAVDPLRESLHRGLMQALAAGGNYAAALLAYRELRLLLHRELNAEPDPETMGLFEQLRSLERCRAQGTAPGQPGTPGPPVSLADPSGHLLRRATAVLRDPNAREVSRPCLVAGRRSGPGPARGPAGCCAGPGRKHNGRPSGNSRRSGRPPLQAQRAA
jgi:DNA-binding SARP family transcriptional activator